MKQTINNANTPRNAGRPFGCSQLATALDDEALRYAIAMGNRATRRVARRNLERLQRRGIAK